LGQGKRKLSGSRNRGQQQFKEQLDKWCWNGPVDGLVTFLLLLVLLLLLLMMMMMIKVNVTEQNSHACFSLQNNMYRQRELSAKAVSVCL
jgi:hypothetical protein